MRDPCVSSKSRHKLLRGNLLRVSIQTRVVDESRARVGFCYSATSGGIRESVLSVAEPGTRCRELWPWWRARAAERIALD